jgi:hypothetical protein
MSHRTAFLLAAIIGLALGAASLADRADAADRVSWGSDSATSSISFATARAYAPAVAPSSSSSEPLRPLVSLPPTLSGLTISPRAFFLAGKVAAAASAQERAAKPGAKVSFELNEAASVAFAVEQRLPRRRGKGGACVKPIRANDGKRKCLRPITLGLGFTRGAAAGDNSFWFNGRLQGRKLQPGSYSLLATPTAGGKTGQTTSASFKIKPAPARSPSRRTIPAMLMAPW